MGFHKSGEDAPLNILHLARLRERSARVCAPGEGASPRSHQRNLPKDHLNHPTRIPQHIAVPEPDNPPTLCIKPCRPPFIVLRVGMLTSVNLNYQPKFNTCEVGNKAANRMLAAKLVTGQTPVTQKSPHENLGVGLVPPKVSGLLAGQVAKLATRDEQSVCLHRRRRPSPAPLSRHDLSRKRAR